MTDKVRPRIKEYDDVKRAQVRRPKLIASFDAWLATMTWDKTVHLSYNSVVEPTPSVALGHVRKMIRELERLGGGRVGYFAATERKFGRLHIHGLLFGVSHLSNARVGCAWKVWTPEREWIRRGYVRVSTVKTLKQIRYPAKHIGLGDNDYDFLHPWSRRGRTQSESPRATSFPSTSTDTSSRASWRTR